MSNNVGSHNIMHKEHTRTKHIVHTPLNLSLGLGACLCGYRMEKMDRNDIK